MKLLIKQSINHPYWVILFVFALSYFALQSASKIKLDNSIDIWFSEDSKAKQYYDDLMTSFDERGFISILYSSETILSSNDIDFNQKLIKRLQQIENIKQVQGYSNTRVAIADSNKNRSFIDYYLTNPQEAISKAKSSPDIMDRFISQDLSLALVRLTVFKNNAAMNYRTMNRIYELFNEAEFKSIKFYLTGTIALYEQKNRLLGKESAKYFVICLVLILILFIVFFRSIKYALIGFSVILLSIIWLLGCFALVNFTANNITNLLLVLILLSSIVNVCNIIIKYKRVFHEDTQSSDALSIVLNKLYIPSLVSCLLSSAMFVIFTMSAIAPIFNFAIFAVLAIFLPLLLCFSLLPACIVILDRRKAILVSDNVNKTEAHYSGMLLIKDFSNKYLIISYVIVIIFGLALLSLDNNPLSGLKKSNLLIKSLSVIDKNFSGIFPLELIISSKVNNKPALTKKQIIAKIQSLQKILEDVDVIANTESVVNTPLDIHNNYQVDNLNKIRITINTKWLDYDLLDETVNKITELSDKVFNRGGYDINVSGDIYIRYLHNKNLWNEQLKYICLSLVLVGLVLLMVFRELKVAVTILIIMIMSILLPVSGMVFIGLNIALATVLFAAIISVFSFNYIIQYQFSRKNSTDLSDFYKSSEMSTIIIMIVLVPLLLSKYLLLVYFSIFFILSILTITVLLNPVLIKLNSKIIIKA